MTLKRRFSVKALKQSEEKLSQLDALYEQVSPLPSKGIPKRAEEGPAPLSFSQQRLWFLDQLQPNTTTYNIPMVLKLQGPLDGALLERCLRDFVERQHALRTVFRVVLGQASQVVQPLREPVMSHVDLSALDAAQQQARVAEVMNEIVDKPFNLAEDSLFRACLLRTGANHHLFIFCVHHIVSDGWSVQVMMAELAASYRAAREHVQPVFAELPIQFTDYAAWQRQWLTPEVLEQHLSFWKSYLADAPELIELPIDFPRPVIQTSNGKTLPYELPVSSVRQLLAIGRGVGATSFQTLLCAFQVLLSRYANSSGVVVGTPTANRDKSETQQLFGFFANTQALFTQVDENVSFEQLLAGAMIHMREALAHQELPFASIVEALVQERSPSHSPLFQVMFSLQEGGSEKGGMNFADVAIEVVEHTSVIAKFDLTLTMALSSDQAKAYFEFNTDLFREQTIARLAGHFANLLEALAQRSKENLRNVRFLSASEHDQMVRVFNQTQGPLPDKPLHQLFREWVQKEPDHIVVESSKVPPERLTYAQLETRSNELAAELMAKGVGLEGPVGVFLDRDLDMLTTMLASLKVGGHYVPLDPNYPESRLRFMLEDVRPAAVVTRSSFLDGLPDMELPLIVLDSERELNHRPLPEIAVHACNTAYLNFTSGSTGRPKGIAVTHGNVVRLLFNAGFADLDARPCVLFVSSPSFDVTTFEVWAPLVRGGRCVLYSARVPSSEELSRILSVHPLDTVWLTAAIFNMLVDENVTALAKLKYLLAGGEALSPPHVRKALQALPNVQLINGYGPTECTTFAATHDIMPGSLTEASLSVPIGRPIGNTSCHVTDRTLAIVPFGVRGELCLGGLGVARGYLNCPALTADKFVPDPFSLEPGQRLYRTGDVCSRDSDGLLYYVGRNDGQVKIRGQRIELGEIESRLMRHPAVIKALVMAREDAPGVKRVVAYVVCRHENLGAAALRSWLSDAMPAFMVPSAVMILKSMPINANGKIDRRALPKPETVASDEALELPRSHTEERLAAIWSEMLRVPTVARNHNFFTLGGHSLLATQVLARIREQLNVDMPLTRIFEAQTLQELARVVDALAGTQHQGDQPIPLADRTQDLPLSLAQQRLWLLDRMNLGGAAYNMPAPMRLRGSLNRDALQQALNLLVARHEALRTHFAVKEGKPVQVIGAIEPLPCPFEDLSHLSLGDAEDALKQRLMQSGSQPFKLEHGPLLRVKLYRLGEDDHVLDLNMHHIISDGWSMDIFFRELFLSYQGFSAGKAVELPQLPIQYGDFSLWQRQTMEGGALAKQEAWWCNYLDGDLPVTNLPGDRPRPKVQTFNGRIARTHFPFTLVGPLRELAAQERASLFMVLLAAFKLWVYRLSGQTDVIIGTPIANRNRRALENIIGFFANTLALRTKIQGAQGFRQILGLVRGNTLGAYDHQDLPFENVVGMLKVRRDLSRSPIFDILFSFSEGAMDSRRLDDLEISALDFHVGAAKFDLSVYLTETPTGIQVLADYNTDIFDDQTLRRYLAYFGELLGSITQAPDLAVDRLPLYDQTTRAMLLHDFNQTAMEVPVFAGVHRLIEDRLSRDSAKLAVKARQGTLTRGQLESRANRLAQYLMHQGIGPEVAVGVCINRDVDMIVAFLAVLKTGGFYIPVDPIYPKDRIAYMLEHAHAKMVITCQSHLDCLEGTQAVPLCLDRDRALWENYSDEQPNRDALPEQSAYVLYTSGSTGRPKGVQVSHASLNNLLAAVTQCPGLTETDTMLAITTVCFDIVAVELYHPLITGALMVIADEQDVRDGYRLIELVENEKVTAMQATPSTYRLMLAAGWQGGKIKAVCCGEAIDREFALTMLARVDFYNLYGPTEATIYSVGRQITVASLGGEGAEKPVTIGWPMGNYTAYALNPGLEPTPPGVAGELMLGGIGLARGYMGRPELTAERFIPHPFADGQRLYRTGDLVRHGLDGDICYLGRLDHQIKLRGFRIELAEIEAAMAAHPQVSGSVVVVTGEEPNQRLLGYVQLAEPDAVTITVSFAQGLEREILALLEKRLPAYMWPNKIIVMSRFPLNLSGKIDRKALPQPELIAESDYVAPRNEVERQLVAIWEELLSVKPVSVTWNFFNLGGHSLLAFNLVTIYRKTFGREVTLADIFRQPTLDQQARFIIEDVDLHKRSPLVPIQPSGHKPPLFCVHPVGGNVQAYYPLADLLGSDQPVYGLQAPRIDEPGDPYGTIEEIAAEYIQAIRREYPNGPYFVLGWSFGGVVAFEMARALTEAGEQVAALIVDTRSPRVTAKVNFHTDPKVVVTQLAYEMAQGASRSLPFTWDEVKAMPLDDLYDFLTEQLSRLAILPPNATQNFLKRVVEIFTSGEAKMSAYRGEPIDAPILLFRALTPLDYEATGLLDLKEYDLDPSYGWADLVKRPIEIHALRGNHASIMVGEQLPATAARIELCLKRIREEFTA